MMTLLRIFTLLAVAVALVFTVTAGAAPRQVQIRHSEPGCHFLWAGGHNVKRLEVRAPVRLTNQDIAAQRIVGPGHLAPRLLAPGASALIAPAKHGVYRFSIRMVDQEMMDNTLVLIVRA